MPKLTTLSIISATAILCFAAPSYAQYGSGTSYGNNSSRSIETTRSNAERERARLDRQARKQAKALEKKAKIEAEMKAKEAAMAEKEKAMMAKDHSMEKDSMMKDAAMKDHSMEKESMMIDAEMKEKAMKEKAMMALPLNCPTGTTPQPNGTCMLTGDTLPRS